MTNEQQQWIENATYEELLKRWRFAKDSDTIFQEDAGSYYQDQMNKKKAMLAAAEQVVISKRIGWSKIS